MTARRTNTYLLDRGGQILAGRYRVTELLGVGAMGSVWVAEMLSLKRPVVVKFHEDGFIGNAGDVAMQRFLREARTLSSIQHRNVIELHEAGRTDEGEPYLIMEQLHGRTLAARLQEEPILPTDEALQITLALLAGLRAVHAAGVLHRDIKPENVFLHEEHAQVVPKLIDFGLARAANAKKRVTLDNKTVGTPGYMAPEQARGEADLDVRADLYALGVTLYEMLSGELPSVGETAMDLMIHAATEAPRQLATHRPDLEGALGDVVMKALSLEREDRFDDAQAMARALTGAADELALDVEHAVLRGDRSGSIRRRSQTTQPRRGRPGEPDPPPAPSRRGILPPKGD